MGYNSPLKTLWKKGKLDNVKYGLYGGELTKDNLSLEHLQAISSNGRTTLDNLALATKENNNKRGSEDIGKFLTFGMIRKYLRQFRGINVEGFNGDKYIAGIIKTLDELI